MRYPRRGVTRLPQHGIAAVLRQDNVVDAPSANHKLQESGYFFTKP